MAPSVWIERKTCGREGRRSEWQRRKTPGRQIHIEIALGSTEQKLVICRIYDGRANHAGDGRHCSARPVESGLLCDRGGEGIDDQVIVNIAETLLASMI